MKSNYTLRGKLIEDMNCQVIIKIPKKNKNDMVYSRTAGTAYQPPKYPHRWYFGG